MIWLLAAAAAGVVTDSVLMHCFHTRYPFTVIFSVCCFMAIVTAYPQNTLLCVKGCLLAQLLIIVGYIDKQIQVIPDLFCVLVALSGLISFSPLSSLSGAAVLFILLMGCRLAFGGIGGGDIKLLTACGWTLGLQGGLVSMFICYFIFCLAALIFHRKLSGRYPLAPYIAVGSIISYLLI